MRLIKMFGLAATAAVVAMAFVGATSASATICTAHDALTCDEGEAASTVTMVNEGVGTLLSSLVNILCLHILTKKSVLWAIPSPIHSVTLEFKNCGTKSAHNNCYVIVLTLPLWLELKTGLDEGTITGENGTALVECENIDIFGIDIHCVYDATGLQFAVGAQHLTANETAVDKISGSLCPSQSALDGLLVTTGGNRYILE